MNIIILTAFMLYVILKYIYVLLIFTYFILNGKLNIFHLNKRLSYIIILL